MSKITFRADDDLVDRLEGLDTSKSEAMREALRAYLDGAERGDAASSAGESRADDARVEDGSIDGVIRERVDELVADRLDAHLGERVPTVGQSRDLRVSVTLDGATAAEPGDASASVPTVDDRHARKTHPDLDESPSGDEPASEVCSKCGETVDGDHVYCPNCGAKASHRVFCECGDEIRSDWAFCPGCGRRTSAADVLDRQ
jgi:hypothetical protein